MSLVNIVHRRAFCLKLNLIIYHYYTYANSFTLVHLSEFEFASIDLTLVRFTQTKDTGVPENYVLTCAYKSLLKRHHLVTTLLLFIRIETWNQH